MKLDELGRRAAACPRWRWLPGMAILGSKGRRVVVLGLSGAPEATSGMNSRAIEPDELPDLSSPATRGAVLALAREAHGDPSFVVRCVAGLWYEEGNRRALVARGSETEAEALVTALEVAP